MEAAIDVAVNGTRMARFGQAALTGLKVTGMSVVTGIAIGTQAVAIGAGVIGVLYATKKTVEFIEKKMDERSIRREKEVKDHGTHGSVSVPA